MLWFVLCGLLLVSVGHKESSTQADKHPSMKVSCEDECVPLPCVDLMMMMIDGVGVSCLLLASAMHVAHVLVCVGVCVYLIEVTSSPQE